MESLRTSSHSEECFDIDPLVRNRFRDSPKEENSGRLLRQFVVGTLWIGLIAIAVNIATGRSIVVVLCSMLALVVGGGVLALFWLARWAARDESRGGRFSIATLLLALCYVSVFLAVVRWLVVATTEHHGEVSLPPTIFDLGIATVYCAVLSFLSLPIILGFLDSLIWGAVWLFGRTWMRSLWMKLRGH